MHEAITNFTPTYRTDTYAFISPLSRLSSAANGLTILLTGASRGIGAATAHRFALAGASTLLLTARTTAQLADVAASIAAVAPACRVWTHALDVASPASVAALFASLEADGLAPDVLCNNAGRLETLNTVDKTTPDDWWATWEVNVNGAYLMTRALLALPPAASSRARTIINTTSIGSTVTLPVMSAYQASKTALNRLTEFTDCAGGARAFCFHPGGVSTGMCDDVDPALVARMQLTDKPELAGDTAVWLACGSEEETGWVRGRYVSANWDMQELQERKEEVVGGDKLKTRVTV
ncbi:putative oxidoreductase [Geopyxis carbonaria]|nr:putative oxidoreductase [Geopyxis carbonaria]